MSRSKAGAALAVGSGTAIVAGYRAVFGSRSQVFGAFPYRAETDDKVVALTFDDGPNEPYTSRLLDTLAEKAVPATFFQVARCAERSPEVTRRVVADGHTLANHSLDHSMRSYASNASHQDQLDAAQAVLSEIAGVRPRLYRPPWLCHPPSVLNAIASSELQVVSGTFCHPLEIVQPPARMLTAGAARRTRPGAFLIFHDGREARGGRRDQSVAAIGPLIDRLRNQGYRFATVDRLLAVSPYLHDSPPADFSSRDRAGVTS